MQGVFEFYCLPPWPKRPKRPERLFFCLFPDTETAIYARGFAERFVCENHLRGTLLQAPRLHISLQHVGDYGYLRTKFVYAARQAGKAVSMHPFEVVFRFVKSFEGAPSITGGERKRPLVLLGDGEALPALHKSLGAAMEKNGLRAAEPFTPHMTLFYGPEPVPMQAIEPIRFVAREFALVHSERGLTRYNVIDRWSLQG
ncbi:2'-5' RNA ligase family protein [Chelativorans alearense]|uniref:2'-5' RNA ligase family protein n=1 Tax=Chelativorans alearense TaxID=2681495 RepID=UPI0013D5DBD9|nr:2'-5' RNA ligase family protein [Chelativorans alearense]